MCVAILLLVGCAQAIHLCELSGSFLTPQFSAIRIVRAEHTLCPICASAHSPLLATAAVSLWPLVGASPTANPKRLADLSRPEAFALCIRPPPAC